MYRRSMLVSSKSCKQTVRSNCGGRIRGGGGGTVSEAQYGIARDNIVLYSKRILESK